LILHEQLAKAGRVPNVDFLGTGVWRIAKSRGGKSHSKDLEVQRQRFFRLSQPLFSANCWKRL